MKNKQEVVVTFIEDNPKNFKEYVFSVNKTPVVQGGEGDYYNINASKF